MAKSFKIILESGPSAGSQFILDKDEMSLGRDVNNDIVINDPEVSRKHARLVKQGESYFFEDLGSTNGTFILGERLSKPVLLVPNSKITIGERVQLSFVVEGFDPSETIVAPRRVVVPPVAPVVPVTPPPPAPAQPVSMPPTPPPARPAPVPPPAYAAPAAPAPVAYPQQPPAKKKSKGLMVVLIILAVILVFCVIPFIIIDATNNWCNLFGGIFQMMGACM